MKHGRQDMHSSHGDGKDRQRLQNVAGRCPQCMSTDSRRAKRDEYAARFFTLRRYRVCNSCGRCFEPPTALSVCYLVMIASVALVPVTIFFYLLPAIRELTEGGILVWRGSLKLLLVVLAVPGFLAWSRIAFNGVKHTRKCQNAYSHGKKGT